MSIFWYGPSAGYHGGDPLPGDVEVPQRPADTYDWVAVPGSWVVNPARAAAAAQAAATDSANALALSTILADPTAQFLLNNSPAVCYQQVQNMVTDLATAKDMLGRFAMILSYVVRELAGTVDNGA